MDKHGYREGSLLSSNDSQAWMNAVVWRELFWSILLDLDSRFISREVISFWFSELGKEDFVIFCDSVAFHINFGSKFGSGWFFLVLSRLSAAEGLKWSGSFF